MKTKFQNFILVIIAMLLTSTLTTAQDTTDDDWINNSNPGSQNELNRTTITTNEEAAAQITFGNGTGNIATYGLNSESTPLPSGTKGQQIGVRAMTSSDYGTQAGSSVGWLAQSKAFVGDGSFTGVRGTGYASALSTFDSNSNLSYSLGGFFLGGGEPGTTLNIAGDRAYVGGSYNVLTGDINGTLLQGTVAAVIGIDESTGTAPSYASYFEGNQNYMSGNLGIGTKTPTEKLEVVGRILMEDGSVVRSGASASLMFDRQDKSAFIIGAGNDAGMSWDQNYDYELRSNTRTRIVNSRYIQNGPLRFIIKGNNGNVGIGTGTNVAEKLHVAGNVFATGIYLPSDKRLKSNVKTFEYGLKEVMKMKPLTYQYNGKGSTTVDRYNVGLYAQNLEKIAPEFVSEFTHIEKDEEDNVISTEQYSKIYDTGIKYMLINAVKEQQDIIETQKDEIATLREEMSEMKEMMQTILNDRNIDINRQNIELDGRGAYLEQNQPNPFNSNTLIKYHVPADATDALVNIFNDKGQLIHSEKITRMGTGEIQVKARTIIAGTYSYSLVVNGKVTDTKRMVIVK